MPKKKKKQSRSQKAKQKQTASRSSEALKRDFESFNLADVVRSKVEDASDSFGTQGFLQDPNTDPCGDGRQTPLNCWQNQAQKNAWSMGLDFHPQTLDDFPKFCFVGLLPRVLSSLCIPPGTDVKVDGIKSKPEINGCIGKVTEYSVTTHRYTVTLPDEQKPMAFRPFNLLVMEETETKAKDETKEKAMEGGASMDEDKDSPAFVPWLHCRRSRGPTPYQLMETRQSLMRFTALTCAIRGSKVVIAPGTEPTRTQVIKVLLAHGANIEARDVAGYTPFHHAFSCPSTPASRALGVMLLEYGADINARTRFGAPALHESLMGCDKDTFAILMEKNASIDIKDNDGCNPANNPIICKPWFLKQILKRQNKTNKQTSQRTCANPDCNEAGEKRCARCNRVRYCSADCQVAHWKAGHKAECGSGGTDDECVVPVQSRLGFIQQSVSLNGRKNHLYDGTCMKKSSAAAHPNGEKFKVKIQVPVNGELGSMMVYDKARSFTLQLEPTVKNATRVHAAVRTGGVMGGLKAFFYAYLKEGNLHIIIQDPLPKAGLW